jgi:hypothetical protein
MLAAVALLASRHPALRSPPPLPVPAARVPAALAAAPAALALSLDGTVKAVVAKQVASAPANSTLASVGAGVRTAWEYTLVPSLGASYNATR